MAVLKSDLSLQGKMDLMMAFADRLHRR